MGVIFSSWGGAKSRVLLLVAFLTPFLAIFGEAAFSSRSFVFRDAAHYYYPLFQWTASEWAQGRAPLWNPYENCGAPALADPTTSVFYPGKLLFALPLDYVTRYKLYILAHVFLAGGAACFTARRWGAGPAAATASGVSYAFGGSVVFQYCNVVYLVGAAWLPLALWTVDGLLRWRRLSWACGLGAVLAIMILGGDPQTAYHAGLVAVLGWRLCRPHVRFRLEQERSWRLRLRRIAHLRDWGGRMQRLALLGAAGGVTALLAAVQILPSSGWTQRSERAAFTAPRSLYEVPAWWMRHERSDGESVFSGLLGRPAAGVHHEHLYQFSVGPWRWAEFLWPNFSGTLFPVHRRWISALPAEGRVWAPSLYLGLAPLVAALAAMRFCNGAFRTRWLTWVAILSLLAALGWYGAGWLWHEVRFALSGAEPSAAGVGAPTGGPYWMLVQAVPGYVYFRYPAKWLTVTTLALSLLAGRGWDEAFRGRSQRARRLTVAFGGASLASVAVWLAIRPFWNVWLASTPADDFLGPLDADGAARVLLFAFLQTAIVAAMLWGVMQRRRGGPWLAAIITSLELGFAHRGLAPTAPQELWSRPSRAATVIAGDAANVGNPSLSAGSGLRVFRASQARWLPDVWTTTADPNRQVDGLHWDQASLYPKHHLAARLALIEANGATMARDYRAFLAAARRRGLVRPDGGVEPAPEALRLLNAGYLVLPSDVLVPQGDRLAPALGPEPLANVAVWRDDGAFPRAWVAHRVVCLPELKEASPQAVAARTREVLLPQGKWRNFVQEAVVETNLDLADWGAGSTHNARASCRIVVDEPQRVEVEVSGAAPGLLVLGDFYDPDWQAFLLAEGDSAPRPVPLLRANRVLRGVAIPAGTLRVRFVYRPWRFYAGAATSAAAWVVLAVAVGVGWRRGLGKSDER